MKLKLTKKAKLARSKGKEAYLEGYGLNENYYQYHTNKQGAIALMAQWDVGWKMAELEDNNPDEYKLLIEGE
jgi:hypothetical protein